MSDTVIRVENLGKKYIIGHQQQERYTVLRDAIANGAKSVGQKLLKPFGQKSFDSAYEEFWALKDVSFEINRGDRVGIIGRNGAGKSTLLKILSRITEPSKGRISIKGRVASLLEVGTGFHPELTGRENIFLNGAILGMSKAEIKKKFDEIVAFSEVEKFLDTPVKRFSSGMYVRLAFAVAAHLESEILVIDEVLAVGDAAFQKKCLGKMEEAGKSGRTVLFVSHNMGVIANLCSSAVLLKSGYVAKKGLTRTVIDDYLSDANQQEGIIVWNQGIYNPDVNYFALYSIKILNEKFEIKSEFDSRESIYIEIQYSIGVPLSGCRVGFILSSAWGDPIFESYDSDDKGQELLERFPGNYISRCMIPRNFLNDGLHHLSIVIGMPKKGQNLCYVENALSFRIHNISAIGSNLSQKRKGNVRPLLTWDYSVNF